MPCQSRALGQAVYEDTRRTENGAWAVVKSRTSLLGLPPAATPEEKIQQPLLTESGHCAATAVRHIPVEQACDGYAHNLPLASAGAQEDPDCRTRWRAGDGAFTEKAQSWRLRGVSQSTALAGLESFPSAAAAKLALILVTGLVFAVGVAAPLRARPADAASPKAETGPEAPFSAKPGDQVRKLTVDGLVRDCVIHVPPGFDGAKPAPLMLVLHGAAMNARMMQGFSGMNAQADASNFIAVYPNGTGFAEAFLTWNSGGLGPVRKEPDDVGFLRALLDDLTHILNVDPRRIYAAGMSNGGMMSYRLAVEMDDRFAAIAAVGGTLAVTHPHPARAVPLIHFHGTDDRVVPYGGPPKRNPRAMSFQSVPETIATWVRLTACAQPPLIREIPDRFADGTTVRVTTYGAGRQEAEVVLVDITGGGHTWPGQQPVLSLIGKSTREISANQMIWEFFQKHPLPEHP